MSDDFSSRERQMLEALQAADSPSAAEQLRVKQRTFAQLGLGAVVASSAALGSGVAKAAASRELAAAATKAAGANELVGAELALAKLTTATGFKLVLGLVGVLSVGAGAAYLLRPGAAGESGAVANSSPAGTPSVTLLAPVSSVGAVGVPADVAGPELAPTNEDSARHGSVGSAWNSLNGVVNNGGKSGLQRETELLAQAHQAIGAGRARDALKLLNEHQKQFPRGTLRIERQGAFALARCLAGETDRGREDADTFRKQHPHSPMNQRLKDACGLQLNSRPSNKSR